MVLSNETLFYLAIFPTITILILGAFFRYKTYEKTQARLGAEALQEGEEALTLFSSQIQVRDPAGIKYYVQWEVPKPKPAGGQNWVFEDYGGFDMSKKDAEKVAKSLRERTGRRVRIREEPFY